MRTAVHGPDGSMTYAELDAAADKCMAGVQEFGTTPGDRVAVWAEKSTRVVAAMQGVMRAGAAYVPIDPGSPPARVAAIANDCHVRAIVTTSVRATNLRGHLGGGVPMLILDDAADTGASTLRWSNLPRLGSGRRADTTGDALAYILYTSGSTGVPKGVCISHRNALAFVDWAAKTLNLCAEDRLSNHAPFHFDLSVLDLYGAFLAGGSVHLIDEVRAYSPRQLAAFIADRELTVWYSVPSVLMLLLERGGWREHPPRTLRAVIFAGEVFPFPQLAKLRERLNGVRLLNFYGPTETNVCTWHEVSSDDALTSPIPIGRAASGDRVWARRADGTPAGLGEEAELVVEGPTVMLGYWGRPRQQGLYATGDIVRMVPGGVYEYVGRRDHMLKIRGHRLEPGEVEAHLCAHPDVREAAVVGQGNGANARLVAFVVPRRSTRLPSLLELKIHLAERVPRYMIVDDVVLLEGLPRTSNNKVDRRELSRKAEHGTSR